MKKNKHYLSVLAIFRNEEAILEEWIEHHIAQGVDHFYLINNSSDDNSLDVIRKYESLITLKEHNIVTNISGKIKIAPAQLEGYNEFIHEMDTEWLYVCDLDEFAYAKNGYSTLKDFIEKNGHRFDQVLIKLKQFTSSGIIQQPKSVVDNFIERWDHDVFKYWLIKPIIRHSKINKVNINLAFLKENGITCDAGLTIFNSAFTNADEYWSHFPYHRNLFSNSVESVLANDYLVSNHYPVQSKEWFFNVKATRGTADWPGQDSETTVKNYFQKYWDKIENKKTISDTELKDIKAEIKK